MGETASARRQLSAWITPRLLLTIGLIALVTLVISLPAETPAIAPFLPGKIIEIFLLGVPAIGLLYAGYWLHLGEFAPDQLSYIGTAAVAGVVVAALVTALVLAVFSVEQFTTRGTLFLFVSTGTEGALLGLLVGVFAVTDRIRREREELTDENVKFRYLERVADIGYWEIQSTREPPYSTVATDGVYRALDLDADESVDGQRALEHIHPEDRPDLEAAIEGAVTDAEPWDLELRLQTDNNTSRWVRSVGEPVTDAGQVEFVRGVLQDITDQKRHETELERQNQRLDEFASVVSHDLRNPLNVATGRLELAQAEVDNQQLAAVERALERIQSLIDDLLTLAREGEAIAELQPVALTDLGEKCWANVETSDASLELVTEKTILADESRLRQVLENLFRNAVEHGGPVVTITVGDLPDGFYVEDDGPGIPEEDRDRVIEPGYSTSDEGTGFGLSIVRDIAQAHGWELSVTEGSDGGARFEFSGVETE